jgi:putative glycosyltransferase (TIGR04348 family)
MLIQLVTPAPPKSLKGNRITAVRWARLLRELGHRVKIHQTYRGDDCDVLIALHARRSHRSIVRFARERPERPLIVAMTGTDLYHDIHHSASARRSLDLATQLVVLQSHGVEELPAAVRAKTRVIFQSVEPLRRRPLPLKSMFEVCVLGHLRPVKDPFRAAAAARLLPPESRIRVTHVGRALSESMRRQALHTEADNPRYRWLGELSRGKALRILARSRLLVLTSKMEGGANVVGEALAVGVPVVSSRIGGTIGILGTGYPGYFAVGDTEALAELLARAEREPDFLDDLRRRCAAKASLFEPARERESWRKLLREVTKKRAPAFGRRSN